jgi:hypothetical protein
LKVIWCVLVEEGAEVALVIAPRNGPIRWLFPKKDRWPAKKRTARSAAAHSSGWTRAAALIDVRAGHKAPANSACLRGLRR